MSAGSCVGDGPGQGVCPDMSTGMAGALLPNHQVQESVEGLHHEQSSHVSGSRRAERLTGGPLPACANRLLRHPIHSRGTMALSQVYRLSRSRGGECAPTTRQLALPYFPNFCRCSSSALHPVLHPVPA